MYADVVVLTYQAPDVQTFTYEIPKDLEEKIKVGQLVLVPFGKRTPLGLIIHLRGEKPYTSEVSSNKIKSVNTILLPTPILLRYQIELLKWMAAYYHASMVNCLKAMLPDIPKRSLAHSRSEIRATPGSHFGSEKSNQTFVLVPSINRIPETLAKYPQAKNHVVYHAEQKTTERFNNWLKILSGNCDYIFGSRSAIFTPCPNLKKIIIYDEHDGAYKDERSPYYDALTIAEKIRDITDCEIEIIDSSPKITTYFQNKNIVKINPAQDGKVQIISMLAEKAAGNRLPISDLLAEYLKGAAVKQKSVLLFLNKKIDSGHVYCRNCKHSEFVTKHPETCPSCNSVDIWFNSLNISSLANLVRKIIPNAEANIILAHPRGVLQTSPRLHPGGESDSMINIATATIFYRLTPQKYDLVAHIATDTALNISDITSSEKVYNQITDLKRLTRGLLVLQTYNPDHLAIKTAATGQYQTFYKNQLAERKALFYPPFSLLVKLSIKGKVDEKLEAHAQNLFDELNKSVVSLPASGQGGQLSNVQILGPYKPFFSKSPRYNIILKIPIADYSLSSKQRALGKAHPYFSHVPKKWQIVIEPDTIN